MNSSVKWLRAAAALTVGLHVAGLIAAVLGIRPGTAIFPADQRMTHIAVPWGGWKIGWTIWIFGAISFVVFNAAIDKVWNLSGTCARLGMAVGVAAVSLDCVFDMLQIVVLPEFKEGRGQNVFLAFARFASGGGIIVANGLYAISVALMSVALRGRSSRAAFWLGMATLVSGLALSIVGFGNDARLVEYFTGPVFAAYFLWVLVLAWQGPSGDGTS
jgi:hypothetical protein